MMHFVYPCIIYICNDLGPAIPAAPGPLRRPTAMAYTLRDEDIANYYKEGYIVFRQILPTALIGDLRRECDKAVQIARRVGGGQAQRLQPIQKYEGEMDMKPFNDYAELPALHEAIAALLTPGHVYG